MKIFFLQYKMISLLILGFSIGVGMVLFRFVPGEEGTASIMEEPSSDEGHDMSGMEEMEMIRVPLEKVSTGDLNSLGATSISWPGEIVSYSDAAITPSRDGKIVAILVRLGVLVKKGQIVARLAPPEATLELTAFLAEKKQALVNAQAQSKATKTLVEQALKRLKEREEALYRSRDATLRVIENETLQNIQGTTGAARELDALEKTRETRVSTAEAELLQAQTVLQIRFNTARAAVKTLFQRFSSAVSINGTAPDRSDKVSSFQLNDFYGTLNIASRLDYVQSLSALLKTFEALTLVPEKEASDYIRAALNLLGNTQQGMQVTVTDIKNLRDALIEDQQTFLDEMKNYQEAKTDVEVKKSKRDIAGVNIDQEIISAETNFKVNEAVLETIKSTKDQQIAQADQEFIMERTDLEVKIAELNRQQELADAAVSAAQEAYRIVESGAGADVRALQAGIISGIYSKIGDYVTVDTPIATTSSSKINERFVRFRIPSDMKVLEKGEEVMVERPGFPLTGKRAMVVGVGISLDANGVYQAEAKFLDGMDWPVNASVRVVSTKVNKRILIPLTAVWWDDEGDSWVWVVDEISMISARAVRLGRATGDRIEIEEGLEEDESFIPVVTEEIQEGQMVMENAEEKPSENEGMEGMAGMDM